MANLENFDQIIERARKKDQAAYRILYDHYYGRVMFACLKICRNKQDAEDIVQDTFFIFYKNLNKIDELANEAMVGAWLKKTAIHECYRKKKAKNVRNEHEAYSMDETDIELADNDETFLPEQYLYEKEQREELVAIIDSLPQKQSEAIYLFYYAGMSASEIAELQNSNDTNVWKTLSNARKNLKQKIINSGKFVVAPMLISLFVILQTEEQVFARYTITGFDAVIKRLMLAQVLFFTYAAVGTACVTVTALLVAPAILPDPLQQFPSGIPAVTIEAEPVEAPLIDVAQTENITEYVTYEDDDEDEEPDYEHNTIRLPGSAEPFYAFPFEDEYIETEEPQGGEEVNGEANPEPETEYIETVTPPVEYTDPEEEEEDDEEEEEDDLPPVLIDIDGVLIQLSNVNNLADVLAILDRYEFFLYINSRSLRGETMQLFTLRCLERRIVVGLYINYPTGDWHMRYAPKSATTPMMHTGYLPVWLMETREIDDT